jgi:predicted O-methyltransferase YrrM
VTSQTHTAGAVPAEPANPVDHAEGYLPDDEALVSARARAQDLGCLPVTVGTGAALRMLAAALCARAVVEIGTGAGVSGLYLLRGMSPDGVLTSIDIEPEFHRAARTSFREADIAPGRTRLIPGRALDVLPRLTDGGYDLVFVDAARVEYPYYCKQGIELLRRGGVIAFHNVPAGSRAADRRDSESLAVRELARALREDERLVPALLPLGGGLLVAAKNC